MSWFMRYFTTTPVLSSGALQQPLCDASGNLKTSGSVTSAEVYPTGSVALIAGAGNVANAAAVATLTGTATTTVYMAGFQVTGAGATAGLPVAVTVTGILGGARVWNYTFAAGVLVGNTPLIVHFNPPIPASAVNQAITVSCAASGLGGTNNSTTAQGFYI